MNDRANTGSAPVWKAISKSSFEWVDTGLDDWFERSALITCVIAMAVVTVANVLARNLMGFSLQFANDAAQIPAGHGDLSWYRDRRAPCPPHTRFGGARSAAAAGPEDSADFRQFHDCRAVVRVCRLRMELRRSGPEAAGSCRKP